MYMTIADATRDERELIQNQLQPGEELLWCGRPDPSIISWQHIAPVVVGGVFVASSGHLLMASLASVSQQEEAAVGWWFPQLVLILFFAVGCWLVLYPWFFVRISRRSLAVVTSRRCMLIGPGFFGGYRQQVFPLKYVEVKEGRGGRGHIIFRYEHDSRQCAIPRGFLDIPDVRSVQHIIDCALHKRAAQEELADAGDTARSESVVPPDTRTGSAPSGRLRRWIAALLTVLALVFGAFSLALGLDSWYKVKHYRGTIAQVTRVEWTMAQDGQVGRPHYRFTVGDVEYSGAGETFSSLVGFREGDPIAVLYDPENPQENALDSLADLWLGALLTGSFACVNLIILVLILRCRGRGQAAGGVACPAERRAG